MNIALCKINCLWIFTSHLRVRRLTWCYSIETLLLVRWWSFSALTKIIQVYFAGSDLLYLWVNNFSVLNRCSNKRIWRASARASWKPAQILRDRWETGKECRCHGKGWNWGIYICVLNTVSMWVSIYICCREVSQFIMWGEC